MENTNCGNSCAFVKSGFCEKDCECPFFSESWWETNSESGKKQKLVKDCSPKRLLIQQNENLHRELCSQSVLEDLRNRVSSLENLLKVLIDQSREFIEEQNHDFLEKKKEFKKLL